jgi:GAF domain-containing protein
MTIGCIIGMFPLFFIDGHKAGHLKRKSHLEALFQDVVTEAKTLIGAESTCLYLRVQIEGDESAEGGKTNKWQGKGGNVMSAEDSKQRFQPAVDGEHLYAMYYVVPNSSSNSASPSTTTTKDSNATTDTKEGSPPAASHSRFTPIGKGIVSRAVLTGEAWNIPNVQEEPDFLPELHEYDGSGPKSLKHMVVVPVLDGQGRTIAVIRALNKIPEEATRNNSSRPAEPGTMAHARGVLVRAASRRIVQPTPEGFTDADVQILKSLASHVSVSLQRLFQDEENEEMRLRDTIRILKEQGLEGIGDDSAKKTTRPSLFPR